MFDSSYSPCHNSKFGEGTGSKSLPDNVFLQDTINPLRRFSDRRTKRRNNEYRIDRGGRGDRLLFRGMDHNREPVRERFLLCDGRLGADRFHGSDFLVEKHTSRRTFGLEDMGSPGCSGTIERIRPRLICKSVISAECPDGGVCRDGFDRGSGYRAVARIVLRREAAVSRSLCRICLRRVRRIFSVKIKCRSEKPKTAYSMCAVFFVRIFSDEDCHIDVSLTQYFYCDIIYNRD